MSSFFHIFFHFFRSPLALQGMGGKGRTEQVKLAGCGHGLAQLEEARGNVFDRIVAQAALKQIAELEEISCWQCCWQ